MRIVKLGTKVRVLTPAAILDPNRERAPQGRIVRLPLPREKRQNARDGKYQVQVADEPRPRFVAEADLQEVTLEVR